MWLRKLFFFLKMLLELSAHESDETAQRALAPKLDDPSFFPDGRRRDLNPVSCPLTSIYPLCYA